MLKSIKRWYRDKWLPSEQAKGSIFLFVDGDAWRQFFVRMTTTLNNFLKEHWKWTVTTLLALLALLVAVPFATINIQKIIEANEERSLKSRIPESLTLLISNKTDKKIRVKNIGSFQLLFWNSGPMAAVSPSGRFQIGEALVSGTNLDSFEVFPGEFVEIEGTFINQNMFLNYTFSDDDTDTKIRLALVIDEKLVYAETPLFSQGRMLDYAIPIDIENALHMPSQKHNK